jgi:hypothetical protein
VELTTLRESPHVVPNLQEQNMTELVTFPSVQEIRDENMSVPETSQAALDSLAKIGTLMRQVGGILFGRS